MTNTKKPKPAPMSISKLPTSEAEIRIITAQAAAHANHLAKTAGETTVQIYHHNEPLPVFIKSTDDNEAHKAAIVALWELHRRYPVHFPQKVKYYQTQAHTLPEDKTFWAIFETLLNMDETFDDALEILRLLHATKHHQEQLEHGTMLILNKLSTTAEKGPLFPTVAYQKKEVRFGPEQASTLCDLRWGKHKELLSLLCSYFKRKSNHHDDHI